MKSLFKIVTSHLGLALASVLLATSAGAQNAARVQIPFAFSANQHGMPPGSYTVHLQSQNYLTLVDCTTGKGVGLLVRATGSPGRIDRSSLIFRVSNRGYHLSQVRFANTNIQTDLATQPKPIRELAGTNSNKTIELAMK